MRNNQQGFTLLELVIVVMLVAILGSGIFLYYPSYQKAAVNAAMTSFVQTYNTAIRSVCPLGSTATVPGFLEINKYLTPGNQLVNASAINVGSGATVTPTNPATAGTCPGASAANWPTLAAALNITCTSGGTLTALAGEPGAYAWTNCL